MTKRNFGLCTVAAAICAIGGTLAIQPSLSRADEPTPSTMPAMPGMAPEMMQRMAEISQPGKMHEPFKEMVGTWDVSYWHQMTPGGPEETTKGTCKNTLILGGRWLQQEATGTMMGQSFNDLGFQGYDTLKKKYVSFWMSSMCTMGSVFYGEPSADGKTITYGPESVDDPMTPGGKVKMKVVAIDVDADKQVVEFYEDRGQGERKCMTMTFTRVK